MLSGIIIIVSIYLFNPNQGQKINPVIYSDDYRNFVPGVWMSLGTGDYEEPPVYIPPSQLFVYTENQEMNQNEYLGGQKSHREIWEHQMNRRDFKNCLFCERRLSGYCQNVPSCLHCVVTATNSCADSSPCLRCSVVRNKYFYCKEGSKYMDQHNSCRCMDVGRTGWCTDTYNQFNELELAAQYHSGG